MLFRSGVDALLVAGNKPFGSWGIAEYDRDLTLLNEWAVELGVETI